MLVLSRKLGEKVVIGNNITVTVVAVERNRVKLAFEAPTQVRILRGELAEWQDQTLPTRTSAELNVPAAPTFTVTVEAGPDLVVSR